MRLTVLLPFFIFILVLSACPAPKERTLATGPAATKGPWVMRVTETEATIFWESREAGERNEVEVTVDGKPAFFAAETSSFNVTATPGNAVAKKPADEAAEFFIHAAKVSGLKTGTCYQYRTSAEAHEAGRFCTARAAGEAIKFMALGDTAATWGETPKIVAAAMEREPDFAVHLGDLQYYTSFIETWASWFRDVAPLFRGGAFFPAVGNHEFEIDDEFPQYYARFFDAPGSAGTTRWYRFESGGVRFISVDTESSFAPGSQQRQWLEAELPSGSYRTTVVYFHKPIYTLSNNAPRTDIRAELEPLLQAHGVKLVLQAHNHGYERFEVDGITYLVAGNGGAPLYDMNENVSNFPNDVPLRKDVERQYGSVVVTVDDAIRGEAINEKGEVIDSFVIAL